MLAFEFCSEDAAQWVIIGWLGRRQKRDTYPGLKEIYSEMQAN